MASKARQGTGAPGQRNGPGDKRNPHPRQLNKDGSSSAKGPSNRGGKGSLVGIKIKEKDTDGSDSGLLSNNIRRRGEFYGYIISIKQGFGFIQPYFEEDHVYFPGRECYQDMKIGDKVAYVRKTGPKGSPVAENLRPLSLQTANVTEKARGVVVRVPDRHRSNCGVVQIDFTSVVESKTKEMKSAGVKEIPFLAADLVMSSLPKNHRLVPGDGVEFTLTNVQDSFLYFPKEMRFTMTKRDRGVTAQIQRMIDDGAVREMGIVTMLRPGEYGFIRALDRSTEIYFRADLSAPPALVAGGPAAQDSDSKDFEKPIAEGSEVDFFVVSETIKGRQSDRAIHVRALPAGSVKFELLVASGISATVSEESGSNPEEQPGRARLNVPVNVEDVPGKSKGETITHIELWQRCLPEELVCKVGDVIKLDVHYYRPEKLFFARAVKLVKFRSIGRETGTICTLKEHSFGFIHPTQRSADLYFKSSQVFRWDGALVPESSLKNNAAVTFDVEPDTGGGGGGGAGVKLRAKRVMLLDPASAAELAAERSSSSTSSSSSSSSSKYTLKTEVQGLVVRNATKKDAPGLIKIHPAMLEAVQAITFYDPEIVEALDEFKKTPELKSVCLFGLPLQVLKMYYNVIEGKFPGIGHETTTLDILDSGTSKRLKIVKMAPAEYRAWAASNAKSGHKIVMLDEDDDDDDNNDDGGGSGGATGAADDTTGTDDVAGLDSDFASLRIMPRDPTQQKDVINGTIQFFKEDYSSPELGPLSNDLKVVFSVMWSKSRCKKVAGSVRLTDEAVTDVEGEQYGVIDVIIEKAEKFGFIRCIPSDEKLFWHMTAAMAADLQQQQQKLGQSSGGAVAASGQGGGTSLPPLMMGSEVAFQIRRRGGLRCAAAIRSLPAGTLSKPEVLPEPCTCVVVAPGQVVMVDASQSRTLRTKYVDLRVLNDVTSMRSTLDAGKGWEKKSLSAIEGDAAGSGSGAGAGIGAGAGADSERTPPAVASAGAAGMGTPTVSPPPAPSGGGEAQFGEDYKPKYCAVLPRLVIPVTQSTAVASAVNGNAAPNEDSAAGTEEGGGEGGEVGSEAAAGVPSDGAYQVGDVVLCELTVNWAVQRSPVSAKILLKVADESHKAVLRKGRINRFRFRGRPPSAEVAAAAAVDADTLACYNTPALEFAELYHADACASEREILSKLAQASGAQFNGQYYFCDVREILMSESCRETIQHGTDVEFWTLPLIAGNIAFHVTVVPKKDASGREIRFNKGPMVNAALKEKAPASVISMAQGPPNDASVGFSAGWRPAAAAASLLASSQTPNEDSNSSSDSTGSSGSISVSVNPANVPWVHMLTHLPEFAKYVNAATAVTTTVPAATPDAEADAPKACTEAAKIDTNIGGVVESAAGAALDAAVDAVVEAEAAAEITTAVVSDVAGGETAEKDQAQT